MEKHSATKRRSMLAKPVSRRRGESPGALSHMVSANLRALVLAPVIREIWAAGYRSYNAVSRELNRRQVPPLRGGKQWYPMTAGRLLVSSGTDWGHLYTASTRPQLTAPTDLPLMSALQLGIRIVCARRRNTR